MPSGMRPGLRKLFPSVELCGQWMASLTALDVGNMTKYDAAQQPSIAKPRQATLEMPQPPMLLHPGLHDLCG